MGIEEQSVIEGELGQDGKQTIGVNVKRVQQQGTFARSWDRNLKEQGFDKALLRSLMPAAS